MVCLFYKNTSLVYNCKLHEMFDQLQLLTGLRLCSKNRNIFWPSSELLMKRSIFARTVYNTRQLNHVVSTMGQSMFCFYANSRCLIEKSSEKYGEYLDKSKDITPDYLKIVGTMKNEKKFHDMKLFCARRTNSTAFQSSDIVCYFRCCRVWD